MDSPQVGSITNARTVEMYLVANLDARLICHVGGGPVVEKKRTAGLTKLCRRNWIYGMLIEEIGEECTEGGQEERSISTVFSGRDALFNAKRAAVGVGARILFYPTLVYNCVRNVTEPQFHWWDQVDECLLLGAVPFPSHVPLLKKLGVCGVITLTEPYETLVPTSLYDAVEEFYQLRVQKTETSTHSTDLSVKSSWVVIPRNHISFDGSPFEIVSHSDLVGYNGYSNAGNEGPWTEPSSVYTVQIARRAVLSRLSYFWFRSRVHGCRSGMAHPRLLEL
ncbi:hypothetical protein ZIOFF_053179 [Zingiber officinale]|uniref:Uncharacterized protein n=1 Tax=Zingiber officinale TaxID=94328 RepID=A0A8J5FFS6_ZINOF|nr:hypothetical protein ZIOFF_053179 [Zingiber officinale]